MCSLDHRITNLGYANNVDFLPDTYEIQIINTCQQLQQELDLNQCK